jgi:Rps23 Pro-64 3,4-dihydroxylase Tpa1-like proline 4-hydroxylase
MALKIEDWIQEQHLQPGAIGGYREEFTSHPARLLVIGDFFKSDRAERLARYLAEDLEYERKFGLYSSEEPVSEEDWERADPSDRFFRYSQPTRVRPESQLSPNTLLYMQFKAGFADPQFRQFFERIAGTPLAYASDDIGAHAMVTGDFMGSHDDDNRGRQLAIIIYLSPGWMPDYGGALRIMGSAIGTIDIPPAFNSMAMFDVGAGTTHQVVPVTSGADGQVRRTIGGWYHRSPT